MAIRKVAILGTRGRLGPWLLKALATSGQFEQVTVLQRAESAGSGSVPAELEGKVTTVQLPADFVDDENGLAERLRGHDAVVLAMPASVLREHMAVANACVKAGVRRFVPADYGSVCSTDDFCIEMVPLYGKKRHMRDMLRGMAMLYHGFTWHSLVPGHFFDYGLQTELYGFNLHKDPPTALIWDGGDVKFSGSTRDRIGEGLVASLVHDDVSENRLLYIQSFATTQNEVLKLLEKVSGKQFVVTHVKSEDYIRQKKDEMEKGIGEDPEEEMVGILGTVRADWTKKKDFANQELGLKEGNLEEEVRKAWEAVQASKK